MYDVENFLNFIINDKTIKSQCRQTYKLTNLSEYAFQFKRSGLS